MWRLWWRGEVCTGFWWGNLRERDHWGDPGADGSIILRRIFSKWEGVVGPGWSWLRIGTGGGHLWVRWGTFGFHKLRGISWLAAETVSFSRMTLFREVSKEVVRVTALAFHIAFSYSAVCLHYLLVNFECTYVIPLVFWTSLWTHLSYIKVATMKVHGIHLFSQRQYSLSFPRYLANYVTVHKIRLLSCCMCFFRFRRTLHNLHYFVHQTVKLVSFYTARRAWN